MVRRVAGLLRSVVSIALLVGAGSPADARAQGEASQAPQAASGQDIPVLVARIAAVRQHYTSGRLNAARDELSGTFDLVRAARETEGAKAATRPAGQLPRAGRDVPMPGLLKRVEPVYPIEAAKRGVTGYVVLDAVIDKSGKVRDPRVARSIPEFDQAALNAARAWRFAAPRVNGTPAAVSTMLVFAFIIRNEASPPDELDLARFYVEHANYSPAEAALGRALEAIGREADCVAAVFNADAEQRAAAAQRSAGESRIKPPLKIKDVKPVDPALAQRARVSGVVIIEGIVGVDGRLQCPRVLRSVPLLDQAALDAVSQWEFEPTLAAGRPVPTRTTITVNFSLQ